MGVGTSMVVLLFSILSTLSCAENSTIAPIAGNLTTETTDRRCKCVCPPIGVSLNKTAQRAVYIKNVSPELCNCDNVVLQIAENVQDPSAFCARCQCKHESRNSATIKTVVICFIVITGLLMIYMVYLLIEARFCKGKMLSEDNSNVSYEQHIDDDYTGRSHSDADRHMSLRRRFGEQMSRWKRAVMQQRGNVYIRRTVLNN